MKRYRRPLISDSNPVLSMYANNKFDQKQQQKALWKGEKEREIRSDGERRAGV